MSVNKQKVELNFLLSNLGESSFSIRADSSYTPLARLYGCNPVEISILY